MTAVSRTQIGNGIILIATLLRLLGISVPVDALDTTVNTLAAIIGAIVAFYGMDKAGLFTPARLVPLVSVIVAELARLVGFTIGIDAIGTTINTLLTLVGAFTAWIVRFSAGDLDWFGRRKLASDGI